MASAPARKRTKQSGPSRRRETRVSAAAVAFGRAVQDARQAREWSIRELAKQTDGAITYQTVHQLEHGRSEVGLHTAVVLSRLLALSLDSLPLSK